MIRGAAQSPAEDSVAKRVAQWWDEAEAAVRFGRFPRARRFLRWILAAYPDEPDAWIMLAALASSYEERITYLRRAYAFHPTSPEVQAALRSARTQQLESAVGELAPRSAVLRGLPNELRSSRPGAPPRS